VSSPVFERGPVRVRFPSPASGGGSLRESEFAGSRAAAGPSASRLRSSPVSSPFSRGAALARERGESDRSRSLAPADRDAILDRYRRVAPQSVSGRGPSSSRLVGDSAPRGSSAASGEVSRRASLARAKNNHLARIDDVRTANAEKATRGLRDLAATDPVRAGRYERAGAVVGRATGYGISVGLSVGLGCYWGGWYDSCYPWGWSAPWYGCGYWGSWWWWWNWSCYPYAACYWYGYGWWPYRSFGWWGPNCYSWYYTPPVYYSTVIYQYAEPAQQVAQVVEEAPAQVGEGVAVADQARLDRLLRSGPDSAARASGQYLTLGDRAFREGRYADAVHFYARAVEFAPDEAVLYLVLSDGLFATGDYHYGAFALRKALELDPTLATAAIDKHEFYDDPREFDEQLAQLESYLIDRPGDDDARLMLAANYLFGGRPAAAVDLLGDPSSDRLLDDPAAALILQAARDVQYGLGTRR